MDTKGDMMMSIVQRNLIQYAMLPLLMCESINAIGLDESSVNDRNRLSESMQMLIALPDGDLYYPIDQIMELLGRDRSSVSKIEFTGHPIAFKVVKDYEKEYLMISTGDADATALRPGKDFGMLPGSDMSNVIIDLKLPEKEHWLSFQYKFITAEYPEYADEGFNDGFSVVINDLEGDKTVINGSADKANLIGIANTTQDISYLGLYSDQPGQLEGEFDIGNPATGHTGWNRAEASISSGGRVTISFEVFDAYDGLVDSILLIKDININPFKVELVPSRYNRDLRGSNVFECENNINFLGGAVADDITTLNIVAGGFEEPGNITFSFVDGNAPQDGGFDAIGGILREDSITIPTNFINGTWQSIAQYRVPSEFNRGGDENLMTRNVDFLIEYVPNDPNLPSFTDDIAFVLFRPVLVLMHGLWSDIDAWRNSPIENDVRYLKRIGDYSSTNAASFNDNLNAPSRPIREACAYLNDNNMIMTKVDYLGHSMGGILGRNFDSIFPNKINKFITMNTPHLGSSLASFIINLRDSLSIPVRNLFISIMEFINKPIHLGALDDLASGSPAIESIQATTIPSHALIGIGGSELFGEALSSAPGGAGVAYKVLEFIDDVSGIFPNIQHDMIVGFESQRGGINPSASTVFDGLDSIHTFSTRSPNYANKVSDLLNTDKQSSDFDNFPAPTSMLLSNSYMHKRIYDTNQSGGIIDSGILITAPTDGSIVEPGESFNIAVAGQNGFNLQKALVFSAEIGVTMDNAPFTDSLTVPIDALGPLQLFAIGSDSSGNFTSSDLITIQVQTDLELTEINIINGDIVLVDPNESRQVVVSGLFSDGVLRNLTNDSNTIYTIVIPSVASVTPEGIVSAVSEGSSLLRVTNNGIQDSVIVTVTRNAVETVFSDGFE